MSDTITTPRKDKEIEAANLKIKEVVKTLNREWDLGLEVPGGEISPSKRPRTDERACVFKITALCFKKQETLPLQEFESRALTLYQGWINKPRADPDLIPKASRQLPRPLSPKEKAVILQCLLDIMTRAAAAIPKTPMKRSFGGAADANALIINDSPLPINLDLSKSESKRSRDLFDDEEAYFKKPKRPSPPPRGRSVTQDGRVTRSANTSVASHVSSIFDQDRPMPMPATQETVPDESLNLTRNADSIDNTQSSEYEGGSSFDAFVTSFGPASLEPLEAETIKTEADEGEWSSDLDIKPSTPAEMRLQESLEGIFPNMPNFLSSVPLHVRYEVVRIYLHTQTSFDNFKLPLRKQTWENYEDLWTYLKRRPELDGKTFPDKVSSDVWAAAQNEFRSSSRGVTMCGSLRFHTESSGPLFRFQLQPLRLEQTYRLRRRFGNDRFLEIDIPHLTGRGVPKVLRESGSVGRRLVIQFLSLGMHSIFGRMWSPFFTKPKEGHELKSETIKDGDLDIGTADRMFFFAIDGDFFKDNNGTPKEIETVTDRSRMSIGELLNWIRPTLQNQTDPYLKLYARTALALSRNTATVCLLRSQIIVKDDIRVGRVVMTDGAGRLSLSLALKIVECMGLSYLPSGFQGRLGPAKGFWVIDHRNNTTGDWIEVYTSQVKWKRTNETIYPDPDFNDPAHRVFEVNKCSDKLKSAHLNLQLLPILMDRAESESKMITALGQLMKEGLTEYIDSQRTSMENPQLFRKWVRDGNPGLADKLKHGCIPYKGGLPSSLEEKVNMLLDAGFDPLKLHFLRDLAQRIYTQKCDDLKDKLNITVARSTYAYMVPDWTGSLKPGEVYIHPSECFVEKDKLLPAAGLPIQRDILVARSPAHFVSDIQRVKAVSTPELQGLKDVIVFPIKGRTCLADILSGGDYDGDLAWVCWEPALVENFVNAKKPVVGENLADFLTKDTRSYAELVKRSSDPTALFLQKSFEFNLGQNMLGICTKFKEKLCYTQETVNSREAIILSELLSQLVDQAKAGLIFTEDDWRRIQDSVIKVKPGPDPLYFGKEVDATRTHIIDRLKYLAHVTIEKLKTEFNKQLPKTLFTDDDLLKLVHWAHKQAVDNKEWLMIMEQLVKDVEAVNADWVSSFGRNPQREDLKPMFAPILAKCYEKFRNIQPPGDTALTRSLLESWHSNPDLSQWALLRASIAFKRFPQKNFVWWMAGSQLCHLKAKVCFPGMVVMAPHMYAMQKPDATFVKLKISEGATYEWQKDLTDGADIADDC